MTRIPLRLRLAADFGPAEAVGLLWVVASLFFGVAFVLRQYGFSWLALLAVVLASVVPAVLLGICDKRFGGKK